MEDEKVEETAMMGVALSLPAT